MDRLILKYMFEMRYRYSLGAIWCSFYPALSLHFHFVTKDFITTELVAFDTFIPGFTAKFHIYLENSNDFWILSIVPITIWGLVLSQETAKYFHVILRTTI